MKTIRSASRIVSIVSLAGLLLTGICSSTSYAVTINNGDFSNPVLAEGGFGPNNVVTDWITTTTNPPAANIINDPDGSRLEGTDVDNNWLFQCGNGLAATVSVRQNVVSLANSSTYVLTVTAGQDKFSFYPFPTVGDGVTTGDILTRLVVDNSALQDQSSFASMPGFVSSTAVAPGTGLTTLWTMTWTTGASETLAGKAVYVEIRSDYLVDVVKMAYFDNVGLTVTAVPEPNSIGLCLLGCCGVAAARRRIKR